MLCPGKPCSPPLTPAHTHQKCVHGPSEASLSEKTWEEVVKVRGLDQLQGEKKLIETLSELGLIALPLPHLPLHPSLQLFTYLFILGAYKSLSASYIPGAEDAEMNT